MEFKSPGGDLVWLTPLLVLAGLFLAYSYGRESQVGMAVFCGVFGILSLLVWFDQKWVAIPLLGFYGLALVGSVGLLITQGFSVRWLLKSITVCYTIYAFWEWRNRED